MKNNTSTELKTNELNWTQGRKSTLNPKKKVVLTKISIVKKEHTRMSDKKIASTKLEIME